MVLLSTVFTIAALRTNIILFSILLMLLPTFSCLSGAFFQLSKGNTVLGTQLQHAGAGILLAISFLGWYLFTVLVLAGVDFPLSLPTGDLSTVIKGATEKAKAKKDTSA